MKTYRIALIPGDGIGKEVVPAGTKVLKAAAGAGEFALTFEQFDWGCENYLRTVRMMPEDGLEQLRPFDAIYLGAIGHPTVPDHISLRDLLLRIRFGFDLYVNLRPVEILPGLESPLRGKGAADINMLFVRENTEGEYCGVGGRFKRGTPDEVAVQHSVFTRKGVERVIRYAFEQARRRRKRLASATKSNAMQYTMVLWDEVLREVARDFPDVTVANYHVDALAARMVTHPETLDVVVGSNLFADILTDLGGALQGSLGLAASANLNPTRQPTGPPMFEPVHGSAPDIEGRGIANPIAAIWTAALMMEHLGEPAAGARIMEALKAVTGEGRVRTPDLGGRNTTEEFAAAVAEKLAA